MMMVVQIAFVGLFSIDKLESLLYPLINIWPVNGYNKLPLSDKPNSKIPPRFSILDYKSYFLPNFNVDLVLILLPFIVGLAIYIFGRIKNDKEWKLKSFRVMK